MAQGIVKHREELAAAIARHFPVMDPVFRKISCAACGYPGTASSRPDFADHLVSMLSEQLRLGWPDASATEWLASSEARHFMRWVGDKVVIECEGGRYSRCRLRPECVCDWDCKHPVYPSDQCMIGDYLELLEAMDIEGAYVDNDPRVPPFARRDGFIYAGLVGEGELSWQFVTPTTESQVSA